MKIFIPLLTVLALLTGCATSTVESRKRERYSAYAALTPEQRTARGREGIVEPAGHEAGVAADVIVLGGDELQRPPAHEAAGLGFDEAWAWSLGALGHRDRS